MLKVGKYTGTGAAITIELGFVPDYVRVVNITDSDIMWEWYRDGSAAGSAIETTVDVHTLAANGITAFAGAGTPAGAKAGFTIGTSLSEAAKVMGYLAIRNTTGDGGQ